MDGVEGVEGGLSGGARWGARAQDARRVGVASRTWSSSFSKASFSCWSFAFTCIRSFMIALRFCSMISAACWPSIPASPSVIPASCSSMLVASSAAISSPFSSSAWRKATISSSASFKSSISASLFNAMCCAIKKSGMSSAATDALRAFSSSSSRLSCSFSSCSVLISWICSLITERISCCSFSIAFALAFTVIERHDWPKRRHAVPSCTCSFEFERARMMCSRLLPASPFCSIIVSFDSRNGMCFAPSARHLTTNASLVNDKLILIPSFMLAPVAPVFFIPSDPARSTRLSEANDFPFFSTHATCRISSACERDDSEFMFVDAVARIPQPSLYRACASSGLVTTCFTASGQK